MPKKQKARVKQARKKIKPLTKQQQKNNDARKSQIVVQPRIQIRKRCQIIYNHYTYPANYIRVNNLRAFYEQQDKCLAKEKYSGTTTAHNMKRIKKAVDILLQVTPKVQIWNEIIGASVPFDINFITLTFHTKEGDLFGNAQYITLAEGNKLLNAWLDRMKRAHGLRSYVWKAEAQENGGLHYHITTDTWMHLKKIRQEWNNLLDKAGYLEQFKAMFGHNNPNSTDVHAVWKIKNVSAYIAKYMSKSIDADVEKKLQKGKIWGCSKNLLGTDYFAYDLTPNYENIIYKYGLAKSSFSVTDKATGAVNEIAMKHSKLLNQDEIFAEEKVKMLYKAWCHSIHTHSNVKKTWKQLDEIADMLAIAESEY